MWLSKDITGVPRKLNKPYFYWFSNLKLFKVFPVLIDKDWEPGKSEKDKVRQPQNNNFFIILCILRG